MDPRRPGGNDGDEPQTVNDVDAAETAPDSLPDPGDVSPAPDHDGAAPESQDDDAYQNSDEALPDDAEEQTIARNPWREGKQFGEV
ncbi:MAG TPA: hypothetical protein VM468_05730 [Mycoplana sp.]|nr:hypothetical protein [Mycoplana sp.]